MHGSMNIKFSEYMCFCTGVDDLSILLGTDTAILHIWFLTFWDTVVVIYSRVRRSRGHFDPWRL